MILVFVLGDVTMFLLTQVHWVAKVHQGALDVLVSPAPPDPLDTEVRRATQVDKSLDSQAFPDQRFVFLLL